MGRSSSDRDRSLPEVPEPLVSPVIDTHTHLDVHDQSMHGDAFPEADQILRNAAAVGVTKVVQIGCNVDSARWSVRFAQNRPDVAVGVAIHPNDAARIAERDGRSALEEAWRVIEELAVDPVVRAVGETGLDYFRTEPAGRPAQQESFRWHIDLAKRLGKTLVIHDRDSHDDVISVLESEGAPDNVVFHCFSGDAEMARYCASQGWYMSFAGVITFPSAGELREALASVPDSLVLVETDAPYLTPAPFRGRPNATYLTPWTVRSMAEVRGTSEAELAPLLFANAQQAFGPW